MNIVNFSSSPASSPDSSTTWSLTAGDFETLSAGASLLGSGGGGDVWIGRSLLAVLRDDTAVEVVAPEALPAEARVVHVGSVGSPDVVAERLVDPSDIARAASAVAAAVSADARIDAIGCIEVGGLNALIAVLVAGHLGVPIIDGDLMGRAFPRIHMTLLAAHGHPSTPLAVVSPAGDVAVVHDGSPRRIEAMLAALVDSVGAAAALAIYPVTAGHLGEIGMRRSLSRCLEIGRSFLAHAGGEATELTRVLGGRPVAVGVVEQIRPGDEAEPGSITVTNSVRGSVARIDFIDEFLGVTVDGVCLARTPEIIIALDGTTNRPLRCDEIVRGRSVVVATLPSIHEWPGDAVSLVGPAAYGLDLGED